MGNVFPIHSSLPSLSRGAIVSKKKNSVGVEKLLAVFLPLRYYVHIFLSLSLFLLFPLWFFMATDIARAATHQGDKEFLSMRTERTGGRETEREREKERERK